MRQPIKFGKYVLLERIAVGGMAEVYAARAVGVGAPGAAGQVAPGFERIVAIKRILPTMGEDPEFIQMFVDEARIAAQLHHANVAQVLELGKHDDRLYMAMEYVSGRDARQLLERVRKGGPPVPVEVACFLSARVCEALEYAHEKRDERGTPLGIVHRDVSPQNVLVGFDGEVKLIDFGIAKADTKLSKTQSGVLKGKFSYMSPEQVKGLAVDRRSDVFAAGVLLWELLCGRKLFAGDSDLAVLEKVRKSDVPPPRTLRPDVPETLERAVLKALASDPAARHQRAIELRDELAPFTTGFGAQQLGEWLRAEFAADHEREQTRIARWMEAATDPDATPTRPASASDRPARAETLPDCADTKAFDVSSEVTKAVRARRRGALARPGVAPVDQRIWVGGAALVFAVAAAVALAMVFSR